MTQNDIMQIKVNGQSIGIMGLAEVMEDMAGAYADRPDEETASELLKRLSQKNYIPESARGEYAEAFLREFRRFLGRPCDEEVPAGLEVKVLGPGCARCDRLEKEMMNAMSELNLAGDIEHVRDMKEITAYGVMGTPTLVINGKIKCSGKVPPRKKIIQWLEEAR